ncbi:MAG: hypothetical protein COV00_03460 [Candidatus Tagabacteria bacterium CG10_big_fil_rev_8_21_14_0_10_40_13]|uniref:Uncharacterized protein n=1 Tax=Candidatus Tagabacteria bacterium CG10_big_fil_rev_8_21_14_0_10_40_13 TaxID=1975022 RepID=A0A2M8L811_9BACT|nr:MAG: hypothetical protein COV00_03460 [Candidatus Tagabacteria bacterium CG10_big_fil_rev_8_21_14_0_10_40_13]
MKEKIKKILHWPWFKIFIVFSIIVFLLIQFGNLNAKSYELRLECIRMKFSVEDTKECKKAVSLWNLFLGQ